MQASLQLPNGYFSLLARYGGVQFASLYWLCTCKTWQILRYHEIHWELFPWDTTQIFTGSCWSFKSAAEEGQMPCHLSVEQINWVEEAQALFLLWAGFTFVDGSQGGSHLPSLHQWEQKGRRSVSVTPAISNLQHYPLCRSLNLLQEPRSKRRA